MCAIILFIFMGEHGIIKKILGKEDFFYCFGELSKPQ